ncbi:metabotropic glutamate receptor 8, partial [Hyalella azteca]|uniref:Metabotropic glutamate receptor 8 n=1 Tax=Hyalella azteca TaxID=294128 RepID=A0A979FW70_HYAAZ
MCIRDRFRGYDSEATSQRLRFRGYDSELRFRGYDSEATIQRLRFRGYESEATILRLRIPQISYASTSTELSDKTRFEFFSRVVPPDNFQAMAMVEIVGALGWEYVSTLSVEGGYGEKGIASFISLAEKAGICVAVSETILRTMSRPEEFDALIQRLLMKPEARAVVMFVDEDNIRKVIAAVTKAGKIGHFLWIGSDSWGAKSYPVKEQEVAAEGAITILPKRTALKGFDEYLQNLKPRFKKKKCEEVVDGVLIKRNCRNVWFKEYWTKHFNCTFNRNVSNPLDTRNDCTGDEVIMTEQEGLVPFVVDAVFAMATAYHAMLEDKCGNITLCPEVESPPPGPEFLSYIRNVSFIGKQGSRVKFNADGDAPGSYFIFQYQKTSDKNYEYVRIGNWTESDTGGHHLRHAAKKHSHSRHSSLELNRSKLQWTRRQLKNESSENPESICSRPFSLELNRSKLQWTRRQLKNESSENPESICSRPCPLGFIRNFQTKITCQKIFYDASIGLMCTLMTAIIFMRYNTTPIIMASGRELCYVLLFGIALCYVMTFVILAPPSTPICGVLRVGLGLGLCICYSAIFTKTNRISRIFNRGVKSIKRPSYTSPRSQILICFGLVGCQLLGVVAWLVVEPPTTKELYPDRMMAVLSCGTSSITLILSLGYNMILILLCTIYAFKTRKIPENFNEAKYIGFTMYSTCIVWLAFVPIYFSTTRDYKIQLASICMCVNISASVSLGCLFTPKVYIVVFQPYKNVRQGSGQGKGSSTNKNYASMKFQPKSPTAQSVLSSNHSSNPATNVLLPLPPTLTLTLPP